MPEDDLDDRERELHPKIVVFWRIATALSIAIPGLIVAGILTALADVAGLVVGVLVLAVASVLTWWYPRARYDRWRWRLTDLAVELDRGVLVRTSETLPYFRIQQIDVNRGPVDRLLGLASLEVTSASASGSVRLPAIADADAPVVRRALLTRAAAAVGDHEGGDRDAV